MSVIVSRLRWHCVFLLSLVLLVAGCGGSGDDGTTVVTGLRVSPTEATIHQGQTQSFTAFIDKRGGSQVTWTVEGGAGNGTVTSGGVYTAPNASGDFTVRATLTSDTSKTATATVHVLPPISVTIGTPVQIPVVIPRSRLTFGTTVAGTVDQSVDWQVVTADGGTIDSSGTYTAPTTTGTYTIQARSKADPTKFARRDINVVANANVRFTFEGKGDVLLGLRPDKAPNTSANLVSLVNKGFYDGIFIHRYEAGFVVQWGDPLTKTLPLDDPSIGTGGPGYTIPFEANDLLHDPYVLAMARSSGLDTAGSQIYITLGAQHSLDGNYVVFGSVLSSTAIVDSLRVGDKITSAVTEAP